jgi:hypothetical protein
MAGLLGRAKHIDSSEFCCHAVTVRTTVTLDPDVERMLKERVRVSRKSFKQVLNNAVREGLRKEMPPGARPRFVVKARPMFLRAGIDPARLSEIADDLEVEAFLRTSQRLQGLEDDTPQ